MRRPATKVRALSASASSDRTPRAIQIGVGTAWTIVSMVRLAAPPSSSPARAVFPAANASARRSASARLRAPRRRRLPRAEWPRDRIRATSGRRHRRSSAGSQSGVTRRPACRRRVCPLRRCRRPACRCRSPSRFRSPSRCRRRRSRPAPVDWFTIRRTSSRTGATGESSTTCSTGSGRSWLTTSLDDVLHRAVRHGAAEGTVVHRQLDRAGEVGKLRGGRGACDGQRAEHDAHGSSEPAPAPCRPGEAVPHGSIIGRPAPRPEPDRPRLDERLSEA